MNQKEKGSMINLYKNQFNHYLLSDGSQMEKDILHGQQQMMLLFFTRNELTMIENTVRHSETSYLYSLYENVQIWLKTIEGHEVVFEWTIKGLDMISSNYDYLTNDPQYKGFYLALELTYKYLNEKAA